MHRFSFSGEVVGSWEFSSSIHFVKALPGTCGEECLWMALGCGTICKVFLNSSLVATAHCHRAAVCFLDLSPAQKLLGVIDENDELCIYRTDTMVLTSRIEKAVSVAFNADYDGLYAVAGYGMLRIHYGESAPSAQPFDGAVVGFQSARVYSLQNNFVDSIPVSLGPIVKQYLRLGDLALA